MTLEWEHGDSTDEVIMADSTEHDDERSSPLGHANPELMSVSAAARYLGVRPDKLLEGVRSGQVPLTPFQVGARIKVSRRQIEAWLDGRLEPPSSSPGWTGEHNWAQSARSRM